VSTWYVNFVLRSSFLHPISANNLEIRRLRTALPRLHFERFHFSPWRCGNTAHLAGSSNNINPLSHAPNYSAISVSQKRNNPFLRLIYYICDSITEKHSVLWSVPPKLTMEYWVIGCMSAPWFHIHQLSWYIAIDRIAAQNVTRMTQNDLILALLLWHQRINSIN